MIEAVESRDHLTKPRHKVPILDQVRRLMRDDFSFYAPRAVRITDKITRERKPFAFNPAQRLLNAHIERQMSERGHVRVMVPKGRQGGISTYVTARGYWRASHRENYNVSILAHERDASNNLFEMVRLLHNECPPLFRPDASQDSAKSLRFAHLNSGYKVATAKNKEGGRSQNIQFFHGSEVAFYPNLSKNMAAVGQAIPMGAPNTESLLESTANGHNAYYTAIHAALAGTSDYEVCFLPWFISEEYQYKPEKGFELSDADWEYKETYGLSLTQMCWRQRKTMSDFEGDYTLFDQEYPASLARAFRRSSTDNPFIRPKDTEKARRRNPARRGAVLMGVDPSQGTTLSDRFAVIWRDDAGVIGKRNLKLQTDDQMEAAGALMRVIREIGPDAVFIDRLGLGAGICDIVYDQLGDVTVIGVKASEEAADKEKYFLKRTEMWGEMREWIVQKEAALLDDDELEADLVGPGFNFKGSQYRLESKDSMKKRDLPSPDFADALAHTFYIPFTLVRDLPREDQRSGAAGSWQAA